MTPSTRDGHSGLSYLAVTSPTEKYSTALILPSASFSLKHNYIMC